MPTALGATLTRSDYAAGPVDYTFEQADNLFRAIHSLYLGTLPAGPIRVVAKVTATTTWGTCTSESAPMPMLIQHRATITNVLPTVDDEAKTVTVRADISTVDGSQLSSAELVYSRPDDPRTTRRPMSIKSGRYEATTEALTGYTGEINYRVNACVGTDCVTYPETGDITAALTVPVPAPGRLPTGDRSALDVPYLDQRDSGWCWATSMSMALRYYGWDVRPWQVGAMYAKPATANSTGLEQERWSSDPLDAVFRQLALWINGPGQFGFVLEGFLNETFPVGATAAWRSKTWDLLRSALLGDYLRTQIRAGHPVILSYTGLPAHTLVVVGATEDNVTVHDPSGAFTGSRREPRVEFPWQTFYTLLINKSVALAFGAVTISVESSSPGVPEIYPKALSLEIGAIYIGLSGPNAVTQFWDGRNPYKGYYYDVLSGPPPSLRRATDDEGRDLGYYGSRDQELLALTDAYNTGTSAKAIKVCVSVSDRLTHTVIWPATGISGCQSLSVAPAGVGRRVQRSWSIPLAAFPDGRYRLVATLEEETPEGRVALVDTDRYDFGVYGGTQPPPSAEPGYQPPATGNLALAMTVAPQQVSPGTQVAVTVTPRDPQGTLVTASISAMLRQPGGDSLQLSVTANPDGTYAISFIAPQLPGAYAVEVHGQANGLQAATITAGLTVVPSVSGLSLAPDTTSVPPGTLVRLAVTLTGASPAGQVVAFTSLATGTWSDVSGSCVTSGNPVTCVTNAAGQAAVGFTPAAPGGIEFNAVTASGTYGATAWVDVLVPQGNVQIAPEFDVPYAGPYPNSMSYVIKAFCTLNGSISSVAYETATVTVEPVDASEVSVWRYTDRSTSRGDYTAPGTEVRGDVRSDGYVWLRVTAKSAAPVVVTIVVDGSTRTFAVPGFQSLPVVPTGKALPGHAAEHDEGEAIAWSKDGRWLVSKGDDGSGHLNTVKIWDTKNWTVQEYRNEPQILYVSGVSFAPVGADGVEYLFVLENDWLTSLYYDGAIWRRFGTCRTSGITSGCPDAAKSAAAEKHLAWRPDGEYLATAGAAGDSEAKGRVSVWDRSGRLRNTLQPSVPDRTIRALAFSSDGNLLAVGFEGRATVDIWATSGVASTWAHVRPLPTFTDSNGVTSLAWTERNGVQWLAVGGRAGSVKFFRTSDWTTPPYDLPAARFPTFLDWSTDGSHLAVSRMDPSVTPLGNIYRTDREPFEGIFRLEGAASTDAGRAIRFDATGQMLAWLVDLELRVAAPFDSTPPQVSISSPTTTTRVGSSTTTIDVSGNASDNVNLARVEIFRNTVSLGVLQLDGTAFLHAVVLDPGLNVIEVRATDLKGLTATAVTTVTRTSTNLAVAGLSASPIAPNRGAQVTVTATVSNSGVTLRGPYHLVIDALGPSGRADRWPICDLNLPTATVTTCLWNTASLPAGSYSVSARVFHADEEQPGDNSAQTVVSLLPSPALTVAAETDTGQRDYAPNQPVGVRVMVKDPTATPVSGVVVARFIAADGSVAGYGLVSESPLPGTYYSAIRAPAIEGAYGLQVAASAAGYADGIATVPVVVATLRPNAHQLSITGVAGLTAEVDPSSSLELAAQVSDTNPGQSLTYVWSAACPDLPSVGTFAAPDSAATTWSVPANDTGTARVCTLRVEVSDLQGLREARLFRVTVRAAPTGQPCTSFAVTQSSVTAGYAAGAQTVTVVGATPPSCVGGNWTASQSGSWLSVWPTTGTGPGPVTVSWTQNPTTIPRAATATIAGSVVVVDQAPAPQPICTSFSIGSSSASPTYLAGSQIVEVTGSPAGCTGGIWTAAGNGPWLTVSPTTGAGTGFVTVSWTQNQSSTRRSDSGSIAGTTFVVSQEPPPSICAAFSINPVGVGRPYNADSQDIMVVGSPIGCTGGSWTASGNGSWLTVSRASGNGPGPVTVSWTQNPVKAPRLDNATIAGNAFTVSQAAAPYEACTSFAISSAAASATYAAGGQTVLVTGSPNGCVGGSWTASDSGSWLTVSPTNGSGPGAVFVSWTENRSGDVRTDSVTIAGSAFTVSQGTLCTSFSLSPTSASPTYQAGSQIVTVSGLPSGCTGGSWGVSWSYWWVTASAFTGNGPGSVVVSWTENPWESSRSSNLTIAGVGFTLIQAAPPECTSFEISPTSVTTSSRSGSQTVTIAGVTPADCRWGWYSATDIGSWLTPLYSGGLMIGPSMTIEVTWTENLSMTPRSGTVTINGKTFTVMQAAAPPCTSLSIGPTSASSTYLGGSREVTITGSPPGCASADWTASGNGSWVEAWPLFAPSWPGRALVLWTQNETSTARTGMATIAGNTFVVNQEAAPVCTSFSINPTSVTPTYEGGAQYVGVVGSPQGCRGGSWMASGNGSWLTVSPSNGSGSDGVTVSWTRNPSTTARSGTATIAENTLTVDQAPAPACTSFSISPVGVGRSYDAGSQVVTLTGSPNGCLAGSWSASTNAPWLTVSPTSGSGSASVTVSWAQNSSATSRSADATIASSTFTVTQEAAPTCTSFSISDLLLNASYIEGSRFVTVIGSPSGCTGGSWAASGNGSWLTLSPISGAGPGPNTVRVSWTWNGSTTARSGAVTIAENSVVVNQWPASLSFSDPTLAAGTIVRAVHLTELRQVIEALRIQYGLAPCTWTDTQLLAGETPIKSVHLTELRTALQEVYASLQRTPPTYSHATLTARTTIITAVDIAELRAAILAIW